MGLIVGLGNPGIRYRFTRHNIGFLVLDHLAERWETNIDQKGFDACYARIKKAGRQILLVKPQSFMNLSGFSVRKLADYFKLNTGELIVVHDDLDLPFGTIRMKAGGGHGGHKGLLSLIEQLGTSDFTRIRVGIGKPDHKGMVEDYVLLPFAKSEAENLGKVIDAACDVLTEVVSSGIQSATTKYNGKTIKIFFEEVK